MPEKAKLLWESMLDADMNARYWGRLARRYQRKEMGLKILLAATSSATVAGWALWKGAPQLWQALSGFSALVAVALPILNYSQRIETMADLRAKWMHLRVEYDSLWAEWTSKRRAEPGRAFELLKGREVEFSKIEATLPRDRKLIRDCQQEVRRSRGI
ncbi:MAG: hypothetical protein WAO35_02880 [Terriglobia bacterium]